MPPFVVNEMKILPQKAGKCACDYTRTLADNGSSILFTLGAEHISDNGRTQEETAVCSSRTSWLTPKRFSFTSLV